MADATITTVNTQTHSVPKTEAPVKPPTAEVGKTTTPPEISAAQAPPSTEHGKKLDVVA